MSRTINNSNIFTIVLFVLLALFEHDEMKKEAYYDIAQSASSNSMLVLGMFVFFALYSIIKGDRTAKKTNRLYNMFRLTVLSISLIAYFWSLLSRGLPSLSIYLLLILPLFLLETSYALVRDSLNTKLFFVLVSLLLVLLVFDYIQFRAATLFMMGKDEGVVNFAYYPLYLFPLLLCIDKRIIRIIGIVVIFAVVVSSGKRGGMVALVLALFVYLMIKIMGQNKRNRFLRLLLFLAIVVFAGYFAVDKLAESDLMIVSRFEDVGEGGSGRSDIWANVINMILNSNPFQWILGHGYGAVTADSSAKMVAHNDFLELMYDYGLIVLFIYISLHVRIIKWTIRLVKEHSFYAAPMAFSYAVFLVNSMVSHFFIYPKYIMLYALSWGAILALYEKEKTQKSINPAILHS